MALRSLRDLYFDELAELCDAEAQTIRAIARLADAARAPDLRDVLERHVQESRLQLERLELIFTHWNERRRSNPCHAVAAIVQEADDRIADSATDDVRDAAIVGAVQRIKHFEIAVYGCARAYARRLNRTDEARLLQETLDEDGRADRRLTDIAEAHVNDDARFETDVASPPAQAGPLRVVRVADTAEPIHIHAEDGAELGTLDGVIVDGGTERPKYAIVDEGGLLARRRYLLPVAELRMDEHRGVLRAHLDKDLAGRYPPFDADRFESMSEPEQRQVERRVLDFFPAGREPAHARALGGAEWWMTGTWMTVSPARAEGLSDQARSFANEFAPDREHVAGEAEVQPEGNRALAQPDAVTPPHGDKLR